MVVLTNRVKNVTNESNARASAGNSFVAAIVGDKVRSGMAGCPSDTEGAMLDVGPGTRVGTPLLALVGATVGCPGIIIVVGEVVASGGRLVDGVAAGDQVVPGGRLSAGDGVEGDDRVDGADGMLISTIW